MFFKKTTPEMRDHKKLGYSGMARRRFFVESVHNQQAELLDEDAHHLVQVLRVETGQIYELSDNEQLYLAKVETARKSRVVFQILEKLETAPPFFEIHLFAALIKFSNFELLIEKATELGVASITPVETVRSERGLERAADKRLHRWKRLALEASQQSRRLQLPSVAQPATLEEALKRPAQHRLFLDEEPSGIPILRAITNPGRRDSVSILVGPEGGWTAPERALAAKAQWISISLGEQILRAETAAIAALAVINALYTGQQI